MAGGMRAQPVSWAWSAATVGMSWSAVPIHRRSASASSSTDWSKAWAKNVWSGLSQPTMMVRAGFWEGMLYLLMLLSFVEGGGRLAGAPGAGGGLVAVPGPLGVVPRLHHDGVLR